MLYLWVRLKGGGGKGWATIEEVGGGVDGNGGHHNISTISKKCMKANLITICHLEQPIGKPMRKYYSDPQCFERLHLIVWKSSDLSIHKKRKH